MKTILITGASSGIGKATAELFSHKGWNVAATMRDIGNGVQFQDFNNINCYTMDVTHIDSVEKCIGQIIQKYGSIDVLVNNAGIYETNPLEGAGIQDIDRLIKTNIYGVVHVTRAILPHFRKNNGGKIINISSLAGRATFPFQSIYHLTKWAVEGFSEGLRYELQNLNIRVITVAPGIVKTSLWKDLDKQSASDYPREYQAIFKNWFSYLNANIQKGTLPEQEARVIYNAATGNTRKLRYSSDFNTRLAVFLHTILPLNTFQSIIAKQAKII
jgi:NADP-dependent 3-hydroxy acid dehydrogenase YdfG